MAPEELIPGFSCDVRGGRSVAQAAQKVRAAIGNYGYSWLVVVNRNC
jgi:hypothetical protein